MTTIEEHVDTVRDFVMEQDELSDFALDALARIEKEAAEKDATIKALADALWETGDEYPEVGWHTNSCIMEGAGVGKPCTEMCAARRSALSLAGRL